MVNPKESEMGAVMERKHESTAVAVTSEVAAVMQMIERAAANPDVDVVKLEKAGVDAVLVGESLMREKDIGKKVKELLGKE